MGWVVGDQLPSDPVQSREILTSLQRNLGHVGGNVQSSYNGDNKTTSENRASILLFGKH